MPGEDRIDSIIDIPAVRAEYDELVKMLNSLGVSIKSAGNADGLKNPSIAMKELRTESAKAVKSMDELATGVNNVVSADQKLVTVTKTVLAGQLELAKENKVISDSYDKMVRQLIRNKQAMAELGSKKAELQRLFEEGRIEADKYTAGLENIEKEQQSLKFSNQELSKAMKNFVKEMQTSEGSLNQLRAQLSQALQAYDNLSEADKKGTIGTGIKKNIDALTVAVSKQEQGTGRFGRNVGNYTSAIKILEKSLQEVTKKIDDFTKSGGENTDVVADMRKEQELLKALIDSQAVGFASLTQEIKANEKALIDMKAAGLENSEAYEKLFSEIGQAKDELRDFKKELITRGDDDLPLQGAIQAAQTLTGVYAIAEGASALFGEENEELQKTFVKLQAVMAILNGLEALSNALKKEGALRTAIYVGVQKISTLNTNLQSAAESKNIIVRYAAVAAQKALNVAMSAAGGPLLAIIGLIALMIISLSAFASGTDGAAKSMEKLNDELEINTKLNEESVKAIKDANDVAVAELKNRFASESEIRMKIFSGMKAELKERQDFNEKNEALFAKADSTIRKHINAKENYYDSNGQLVQKQKTLNDEEEKELDAAISIRDRYNDNQEKQFDLEHQIKLTRLQFLRDNAVDTAKVVQQELEIEKLSLVEKSKIQAEIMANETRSFEERIEAAKKLEQLQKSIARNQASSESATPGLSDKQLQIIEKNKQAAINEATRQGMKMREDLLKQQADRERKAQFEIARISIEQRGAAAMELMDNENKLFEDRLFAAYEYQKAQEALITGQKNLELTSATLTATERLAIEEKANADILNTKIDFQKKVRDITLQNLDEESRRRILASDKARDEAITALNEQYNAGKLSLAEYNRDRLKLEKEYTIESLQLQIENTRKLLAEYKKLGINTAEQEARLAELQKNLSDEVTNKKIDNLNKLKEKEKELTDTVVGLVSTLITAGYDRELNSIQKQMDKNDELKAKEIERINSSTLSEQDKAAKIKVIEAQNEIRREQLERRQREVQLKQAKFDRDKAILEIIANTAIAIIKSVKEFPLTGGMPFAAINAAIGAAQVATILAKPLPRFADGTEYSPEGFARVSERGPEMMVTPDGRLSMTPNKETIMWLQKGTRIIPNDELNKVSNAGMVRNYNMMASIGRDDKIEKKIDALNSTMVWHAGVVTRGLKKIKPGNVIVQDMGDYKVRIQKQVFD